MTGWGRGSNLKAQPVVSAMVLCRVLARVAGGCGCRSSWTGSWKIRRPRMLPPMRQSYGRTRRRRSHHALVAVIPGVDPLSRTPKLHHRVCKESGYVRPGLRISVPKLGIGTTK